MASKEICAKAARALINTQLCPAHHKDECMYFPCIFISGKGVFFSLEAAQRYQDIRPIQRMSFEKAYEIFYGEKPDKSTLKMVYKDIY